MDFPEEGVNGAIYLYSTPMRSGASNFNNTFVYSSILVHEERLDVFKVISIFSFPTDFNGRGSVLDIFERHTNTISNDRVSNSWKLDRIIDAGYQS